MFCHRKIGQVHKICKEGNEEQIPHNSDIISGKIHSSPHHILFQGDVKKTRPHGYPWVIPAMGRVWGEDFALRAMGTGILNTRILNGAGAGITIPIPMGTRYEITILFLSY